MFKKIFFTTIFCLFYNQMSCQSLCKDLFIEDILLDDVLEKEPLFDSICDKLDTDLEAAFDDIDAFVKQKNFKNNYQEAFCYYLYAVGAHHLNKPSEEYVSIKRAYHLSKNLEDSLLKVMILTVYGVNVNEYNISDTIVLDLFNQAESIAQNLPENYRPLHFFILTEIGKVYLNRKDYDASLTYFIKANDYIDALKKPLMKSSGYNNIGYGYYKLKQYDKALAFYKKSLKLLKDDDVEHINFKANVFENFGHIYDCKNDKKKAISYYNEAIKLSKQVNNINVEIRSSLYMVLLYDDLAYYHVIPKEVENTIDRIRSYFSENKGASASPNFNDLPKRFFDFLMRKSFYENTNETVNEQFEEVWNDYQNYIEAYNDVNIQASNLVTEDYVRIINSYYDQEIEREKSERAAAFQKQFGIITMLILIILVIVVLLRNRTLKLEAVKGKNKIVEIEKSMIQKDLNYKNDDIINLSTQLNMMADLKKNIIEKITALSEVDISKEHLKKLLQELKVETSIEDRLQVLKSDIDNMNSQFLSILMNKYPKLSKTEREICSLIRLNLSTKEIATIRNTSVNAVKMNRSRIRKKLGLEKHQELDGFIAKIN